MEQSQEEELIFDFAHEIEYLSEKLSRLKLGEKLTPNKYSLSLNSYHIFCPKCGARDIDELQDLKFLPFAKDNLCWRCSQSPEDKKVYNARKKQENKNFQRNKNRKEINQLRELMKKHPDIYQLEKKKIIRILKGIYYKIIFKTKLPKKKKKK